MLHLPGHIVIGIHHLNRLVRILLGQKGFERYTLLDIVYCKHNRIMKAFKIILYLIDNLRIRDAKRLQKQLLRHPLIDPYDRDGNRYDAYDHNYEQLNEQAVKFKSFQHCFHQISISPCW
ncbi:hypothetical protein D3C80_1487690 [compost metagenome]